jgi:Tfp pilus assembly protein PilF
MTGLLTGLLGGLWRRTRARAWHRRGALCARDADYEAALAHLRRAVALDPHGRDAHIDLGNVHKLREDAAAAAEQYRAAIGIDPRCGIAHYNLGLLFKELRRFAEAAPPLARAVELMPGSGEALREHAACLIELMRFEEAIALLAAAAQRAPGDPQLQVTLGYAYQRMQDPRAALACYRAALALGGDVAELHNNLGIVLQDVGLLDEALSHYDRALALQPEFPAARFHRALVLLLRRDYAAGWPDYEMRLRSEEYPRRARAWPHWDGTPLGRRTLLVYGEQGLGDEIMFASCFGQLLRAGGHCVIECAPKLEALFRRSFPAASVYAATAERAVPEPWRERIDCEVPAGSLPQHYRRHEAEFPAHAGYLTADPARTRHWRARLDQLGPGLKVGISWRGGAHKTRRPLRSIPLSRWAPLLEVPRAAFVSLQYDECAAELGELARGGGPRIVHWPEAVADYEDTAALVGALDLVVSVCTAVIHLGGALGRPVWVMAPYSPEWRYGFSGPRMPWYPSVRVFRQPEFGAWDPVIAEVARELHAAARGA